MHFHVKSPGITMSLFNLSTWHKHGFFYCEGREIILHYRMGFEVTIVLPVPEIVDWHITRKEQNPSNSLFLCSTFVCSLSCLEDTLWPPGRKPHWIHSWITKDILKANRDISCRNTVELVPVSDTSWSVCHWQGCQGPPEHPVQSVRLGPTAWPHDKTANWQSTRHQRTIRAAAILGASHQAHLASA